MPRNNGRAISSGSKGHMLQPSLVQPPTRLESLGRTMRNYIPPALAARGRTRPRPPSFGSFVGIPGTADPLADVLSEDEGETLGTSSDGDGADAIVSASWDTLPTPSGPHAVLLLGYVSGLQIWDIETLDAVREVLNLDGPEIGTVLRAIVLPVPPRIDPLAADRPLVAILTRGSTDTRLLIYSLTSHQTIQHVSFPAAASVSANQDFIVISTYQPPTLQVLSATTFTVLHTVASHALSPNPSSLFPVFALSRRLLAYASPAPHPNQPTSNVISQAASSPASSAGWNSAASDISGAAYKIGEGVLSGVKALGGMAFGSAPSAPDLSSMFSRSAPTSSAQPFMNPNQASFGSDSSGRNYWSRRESFGDEERGAVVSRGNFITVVDLKPVLKQSEDLPRPAPNVIALFAVGSPGSSPQPLSALSFSPSGTMILASEANGSTLKMFGLKPVANATRIPPVESLNKATITATTPRVPIPKSKTGYTRLPFHSSPDRPTESSPSVKPTLSPGAPRPASVAPPSAVCHLYDLVRGVTHASIENIGWASDARWCGLVSGNRTLHVFALNPYGGKPDEASHLMGRVRDPFEPQPYSTTVHPVTRLRSIKSTVTSLRSQAHSNSRPPPVIFKFLHPSASLASTIIPPPPTSITPLSSSPSKFSYGSPGRVSPPKGSPSATPLSHSGFQDVLVFDPAYGTLSLRRMSLRHHLPPTPTTSPPSGGAAPHPSSPTTSRSPPNNTGTSGVMSAASASLSAVIPSGLTNMIRAVSTTGDDPAFAAEETVLATWELRRGRDWNEVKNVTSGLGAPARHRHSKSDWLSQSELSTFSRSREMLPGPVYLSHQITFGAFLDDYHALVRRHDLNLPSRKLEVRKEVEASAAPVSGFLESDDVIGGSDYWQRSRRRRSGHSSFDEPIASAMHSDLEYSPSPPVIPMFPNGPLSTTMMDSIPIGRVAAGLTDGVSEGLGRLKRELGKVRSPKLKPTSLPATMEGSLEFDEDDELVFSPDVEVVAPTSPPGVGLQTGPTGGVPTTKGSNNALPLSRSSSILTAVALSAPATESLSATSEGWGNWGDELREATGVEYREAVEEDTKFDDMVNGVLEQEAAERAATLERRSAKTSHLRADPAGRKKVKKVK